MTPRQHRCVAPAVVQLVRRGFTLIELMIVVVIIAILMALVTPAVQSAIRRGRLTQASTEIQGLTASIEDFKVQYGTVPPSYIDLTVVTSGGVNSFNNARTLTTLRRLWPSIDLTAAATSLAANAGLNDKKLDGSAALVFFLGGVPDTTATPAGLTGFSSNPRNPFAAGGKRLGPYYEFKANRLVDDSDGNLAYLDPLPGQASPLYYVTADRYGAADTAAALPATGPLKPLRVYKRSTQAFWNAQSYQIISPGFDGQLRPASVPGKTTVLFTGSGSGSGGLSPEDKDNLTNFNDGPLAD